MSGSAGSTGGGRIKLDDLMLKAMELPVLPATAQKVLSIMSDPDVSIEKIRRLISADPALAAQILKMANSAFYGGYRNIQNLTQAIMRLGLASVRNIVISASIKNVYKRFGLTEKLLWEQMLGSAVASSIVARVTQAADPEDAFIGGLLHDIGKVVMNNEYPQEFSMVMERVYNENVTFLAAEKDIFSFTHREVGAMVVKKWGFPDNLQLLVRYFDTIDRLSSNKELYALVLIIMFSDLLCQKFGIGWKNPGGDAVNFANLPELMGLTFQQQKKILENVEVTFSQGLDLF